MPSGVCGGGGGGIWKNRLEFEGQKTLGPGQVLRVKNGTQDSQGRNGAMAELWAVSGATGGKKGL